MICFQALVGNKIDRENDREIPFEAGDEFATANGMYFLETSAKACDNVERLFREIAVELLAKCRAKDDLKAAKEVDLTQNSTTEINQRRNCCK